MCSLWQAVSRVLKVILNTQTQKIDIQITANHWNADHDTTPILGGTKTGFSAMHSQSEQKLPDLCTFSQGSSLVPKKTRPRPSAGLDSWYNRIRSSKFGLIDWNKLFGGYNPGWIFALNLDALAYLYLTIYWHTRGFFLFLICQKSSYYQISSTWLVKKEFFLHQARLARSSWLKSQAGKLSDRKQRVLHLCG